ncbi:signal transduction histidine kinase [Lipomyces japonicus]|uniref:signal transduction histidine kinase n=1 Tax=Lipomyces japonicus TaxID=56871 RepID=UPI0034CF8151
MAQPGTGSSVVDRIRVADVIDWSTFDQILEMDDDEDDREFSKSIVWNFFEQAENTFTQMESAISSKDLSQLSSLGHFLKGSSAALGLKKVKDSCEKIQHLGAGKDETGIKDVQDDELLLSQIKIILDVVRKDYAESEIFLQSFYEPAGIEK